jgi:hypothetical protein
MLFVVVVAATVLVVVIVVVSSSSSRLGSKSRNSSSGSRMHCLILFHLYCEHIFESLEFPIFVAKVAVTCNFFVAFSLVIHVRTLCPSL